MIVRTGEPAVGRERPAIDRKGDQPADAKANPATHSLAVAEQWIGQHPALAVGAALMMGVLFGCWMKRR